MKPILRNTLCCPECSGELEEGTRALACTRCSRSYPLQNGIPAFTPPPPGLKPSEKLARGPEIGTPWRQANWHFLQAQISRLPVGSVILDVGAGRGDFADLLQGRPSIALEIYPYPEVDVVCDLTLTNPFRPSSFDAILLMNVLEHVYDAHALLASLSSLLRPGGVLLVAVPFMVKMHQVPVDYARYTHYALQRQGADHGLETVLLEGYYDPIFFLEEGLGNLRNAVLPGLKGMRRRSGRLLLAGITALAGSLQDLLGKGQAQPPEAVKSLAPTGYQIVFRKKHS
jgi:SAM-dependent methyltransferase